MIENNSGMFGVGTVMRCTRKEKLKRVKERRGELHALSTYHNLSPSFVSTASISIGEVDKIYDSIGSNQSRLMHS